MDQGNYGIVHSPDLTDKEGLFRFHDDDLPPMITRPPTLIKNESDDFHEVKGVDTDVSFNVKDLVSFDLFVLCSHVMYMYIVICNNILCLITV